MKILAFIVVAQLGVPFPSQPPNVNSSQPIVPASSARSISAETRSNVPVISPEIESTAPGQVTEAEIESTAPGQVTEPEPEPLLAEQIPEGVGEKIETGIGSTFGQGYLQIQKVAQGLNFGLENLWAGFFNPGSMYSQVQRGILPFTMVGVVLWVYALMKEAGEKGFWSDEAKQRILWAVFVAMLIGNDGKLLGQGIQVLNEIVLNTNQMALDASFNGVSNRDAIREAQLQIQLQAIKTKLGDKCDTIPTDKGKLDCLSTIEKQAIRILKDKNGNILTQVKKGGGAIVQTGVSVASAKANAPLVGILSLVSTGFYVSIRVALLAWASSAPVWVAITLFPLKTRGINIFLMGFWSIGMVIICHTILHGLIAWLLATSISGTPLLFALVSGAFVPIGAIILAAGSSIALVGAIGGGGVKVVQALAGGKS